MASRSYRNHNPGNIRTGTYAKWIDSKAGDDGVFATFRNTMMGVAALARLLAGGTYNNLTMSQAISRYAPPTDHNPTNDYIDYVCKYGGVKPTDIVGELGLEQCLNVLDAMARFEGWQE